MKVDPAKFYWMRYSGTTARSVTDTDGRRHPINPKELFGVRQKKDSDEVLFVDGHLIKVSVAVSDKLMDAAKEFKGRTPEVVKATPAWQKAPPIKKPVSLKKAAPSRVTAKRIVVKPQPAPTHKPERTVLHEYEFPELEDFSDDDVSEFRRYHTVESSGVLVSKIRIALGPVKD